MLSLLPRPSKLTMGVGTTRGANQSWSTGSRPPGGVGAGGRVGAGNSLLLRFFSGPGGGGRGLRPRRGRDSPILRTGMTRTGPVTADDVGFWLAAVVAVAAGWLLAAGCWLLAARADVVPEAFDSPEATMTANKRNKGNIQRRIRRLVLRCIRVLPA